jgi:hypothetical protein
MPHEDNEESAQARAAINRHSRQVDKLTPPIITLQLNMIHLHELSTILYRPIQATTLSVALVHAVVSLLLLSPLLRVQDNVHVAEASVCL